MCAAACRLRCIHRGSIMTQVKFVEVKINTSARSLYDGENAFGCIKRPIVQRCILAISANLAQMAR
jgi:hypothetical protein